MARAWGENHENGSKAASLSVVSLVPTEPPESYRARYVEPGTQVITNECSFGLPRPNTEPGTQLAPTKAHWVKSPD